jgi:hypothetical protein
MKLKFTPDQADAFQSLRQNSGEKAALKAALDQILSEKFRKPVLESNVEQFSDLGVQKLAYQKARLDGAFDLFRFIVGELYDQRKVEEGETE